MASSVKAPSFKGLKTEDLDSFIQQMELRFYDAKITSELDKVLKICMSLRGEAATWVSPYLKKFSPQKLLDTGEGERKEIGAWSDYNTFCNWLRVRHGKYYNFEQVAENKIFNLKQGRSNITEFNAEFDRLRAQLPKSYTDEVLLVLYKRALNSDILARQSVLTDSNKWTIDQWMVNSQNTESNRLFNLQRDNVYLPRHGRGNQVSYHAPADPNAMEIDNVNIDSQHIGFRKRTSTNKETRTCYKCGTKGHLAKNCRRKGKTSRFRKSSVRQNEMDILDEEYDDPMEDDDMEEEHF